MRCGSAARSSRGQRRGREEPRFRRGTHAATSVSTKHVHLYRTPAWCGRRITEIRGLALPVLRRGSRESAAVAIKKTVRQAIVNIAEDPGRRSSTRTPVRHGEEERRVSGADIAEIGFTAFTGKKKQFHTAAGLIVRRVKRGRRSFRLRLPRQGTGRHHPPPPGPRPGPDRHRRPPRLPAPAATLVLRNRLHRHVDDNRTAHDHVTHATEPTCWATRPQRTGHRDGHPAQRAAQARKKNQHPVQALLGAPSAAATHAPPSGRRRRRGWTTKRRDAPGGCRADERDLERLVAAVLDLAGFLGGEAVQASLSGDAPSGRARHEPTPHLTRTHTMAGQASFFTGSGIATHST